MNHAKPSDRRPAPDSDRPHGNLVDGNPADGNLVGRLQAGDAAAYRALMQAHNRRLYRMARSVLHDPTEAEDAVQDAYVLAFTHLDQLRDASTLGTWLGRIVLNVAFRRLRPRPAMTEFDDEIGTGDGPGAQVIPFPGASQAPTTPEEDAARAEVRRLLERAVDELPEAFRIVFVLREVERMSGDDVAALLGIPADTVKTRLHRARRLLGQSLRRRVAPTLTGVFPFAGDECARIVARVLHRLGLPD